MTGLQWLLVALGVAIALYAGAVLTLILLGRRGDAVALAAFIPDCAVLFKRLIGDERVPRRSKLLLVGMVGYLAMPIDLVPDVIPVAGVLDDAILAALVLRIVLRGSGPELLAELWPGPDASRRVVQRLAFPDQHPPR